MMSLQIVVLCHIVMMLAVPTTIYLLVTFRGQRVEEVKPQDKYEVCLDNEANLITDTMSFSDTSTGMFDYQYPEDWEPCDAYYSDQYEAMMDREAAREAGCTVKELCRCGYAAKNPSLGNGDLCDDCFIPNIGLDVIERARLLSGEPLVITCTSFARFVIAVKFLRKLENLKSITFTLESGTEGVYDIFWLQPAHQEVFVEHHFLLEGCPGGDTSYSCYSYEEWVVAIAN